MKPKISIIVIVKNDRGIADTLAGLEAQRKPVLTEIIVVDASDPSIMADIRERFSAVRWYQFIPTIANKSSIPEQRNFGIQHAEGDIIVFIDANCVPSENWLTELTRPILNGTETMTAGSVGSKNPKTTMELNPVRIKEKYLSHSATINIAFKKEIWRDIGKFDESFLFGSDVDFTWRSIDVGNRILFVPQAKVMHDWGSFNDEMKRSFKYGKARATLLKKHFPHRKGALNDDMVLMIYTAWLIGLPLTFIISWYPITILIPVIKNINRNPIRATLLNLIHATGFLKELFV